MSVRTLLCPEVAAVVVVVQYQVYSCLFAIEIYLFMYYDVPRAGHGADGPRQGRRQGGRATTRSRQGKDQGGRS